MKYKCNVCGNEDNNSPYVIREMMFGLRHEFTYIQCAKCGCLQIARIPEDMDVYYPDSYYSFQQTGTGNKHKSLKSRFADYLMTQSILIYKKNVFYKEINSFKKMSKQLNTLCDGDRACFYLKSNKANQINPLNE